VNQKPEAWLRPGSIVVAAAVLVVATVFAANAARPTDEQQCQARKNRIAGDYAECLSRAERNLVLGGDAAEYTEKVVLVRRSSESRATHAIRASLAAGILPKAPSDFSSLRTIAI
jgi:hypothetical protein